MSVSGRVVEIFREMFSSNLDLLKSSTDSVAAGWFDVLICISRHKHPVIPSEVWCCFRYVFWRFFKNFQQVFVQDT